MSGGNQEFTYIGRFYLGRNLAIVLVERGGQRGIKSDKGVKMRDKSNMTSARQRGSHSIRNGGVF